MDIFVVDDQPPEAVAMLQALYSRSAKSARAHLEQVRHRGTTKFMSTYYVGYGHASIGDCGSTTVFIENVSMIAAKAIQDNPLYNGQETSTRYIDFANQGLLKSFDSDIADSIHLDLLSFYRDAQKPLHDHLCRLHIDPLRETSDIHIKAINARKFDILRAFLPAGIKTQLSWSTTLRQAADNLIRLSSHPLTEVREISKNIHSVLVERYPSSFSRGLGEPVARYNSKNCFHFHYPMHNKPKTMRFFSELLSMDKERLSFFQTILNTRPRQASLPRDCGRIARFRFRFPIDFGSYRDLQRHRNGFCPNPILTNKLGFEPWYLEQLPTELRSVAIELLRSVDSRLAELEDGNDFRAAALQYYVPMGYRVACDLEYDLGESIYVAELRSRSTVHPTLRVVANQIADYVRETIGPIQIYNDETPDAYSVRRGGQDILTKAGECE